MGFFVRFLGSFGFTGFFPFAPATFASLVFAAIYTFVPGGDVLANPYIVAATLVASVPVSTYMEREFGHDAGCIVIDEVVGMQMVFLFAQPTLMGVAAGFVLFRVFDIVKPYPSGRSQRLRAGWGVVADDFVAGLYTRAAMIVLAWLVPAVGEFL